MADFLSFENLLRRFLKEHQPKRVMEWGPGTSTKIILEVTSARIISIDHNPQWIENTKRMLTPEQLERVTFGIRKKDDFKSEYSYIDSSFPWDFAFVDGRRRCECVLRAALYCPYVMLHDWEREQYKWLADYLEVTAEDEGTVLFKGRVRDGRI